MYHKWYKHAVFNIPGDSVVKNLPAVQQMQFRSLDQEDPLEKEGQPIPVLLLGKFHGQRNLAGDSP